MFFFNEKLCINAFFKNNVACIPVFRSFWGFLQQLLAKICCFFLTQHPELTAQVIPASKTCSKPRAQVPNEDWTKKKKVRVTHKSLHNICSKQTNVGFYFPYKMEVQGQLFLSIQVPHLLPVVRHSELTAEQIVKLFSISIMVILTLTLTLFSMMYSFGLHHNL